MKELLTILRYEVKSSLRQLSSAIHLNTIECILLISFGILISAALGYVRLATNLSILLMPTLSVLSLIIGLISFNKRNALELISGEKNLALRTLPTDYRIIQYAKLEKLLFASFTIYAAVCLYILAAFLLSGSSVSVILHIIIAMLAFISGQSLRALILVIGKNSRYFKYLAGIAAICITITVYRSDINWPALLDAGCAFYTANTISILITTFMITLLTKIAIILARCRNSIISHKSDMRSISARFERFLSGFNSVTLRDMRGILHSAKDRRRFISNLITLPVLTWVLAAAIRINFISIEISTLCTVLMLSLLIGTGYSGLFENQMTMGFEGNMILAYVLSGSSVSSIQLKRLKGSLMIVLPLTFIATATTSLLLGTGFKEALAGMSVATASCTVLSCINAYYLIKGTSYHNEVNRPRMASGIIRIIIKTLLDMMVMIPVTLSEFLNMDAALPIIICGYAVLCTAISLLYFIKLKNGDRYFYGEYQSIAA